MHLSLYHSRGYFSVFYRQLINNSLGNLPSSLFSNLGNLTELYVEIYMYRSLLVFSLIYIYIYIYIYNIYIYIYIDINICSVIWAKGKRLDNSLVALGEVLKTESRCSLCFFFTLTRAFNKRNPKQGKMTKSSGRDLQHVMIEMVLTMLHFSIIWKIVFNENGR